MEARSPVFGIHVGATGLPPKSVTLLSLPAGKREELSAALLNSTASQKGVEFH